MAAKKKAGMTIGRRKPLYIIHGTSTSWHKHADPLVRARELRKGK
jgi:hypothetical protein